MRSALAMAAVVLGACGCTLLSRGSVLEVRYFSPELPRAAVGAAAEAQGNRPVVRLGRVRGAPNLRERIAHRQSEYEVGYYDDREWTGRPEVFVRNALVRKLFEERGFERATGGPASTLQVEVLGFEELRMPSVHAARVELRYQLQNDVAVLQEQTLTIDRAVSGARFEDFVAAISGALDEATTRIADAVARSAPPRR